MAPNGTKRRKLAHSSDEGSSPAPAKTQKAFFKNAASWDLEQDYESRPRMGKKKQQVVKESNRLPTKNVDGRIEVLRELENEMDSDEDWLEGREDDVEEEQVEEKVVKEVDERSEQEQILEAQEELAKLAMAVNENPEDNVGAFKQLGKIGSSKIPAIKILALMTQMTVYKDIIPGYRIRPLGEDSGKEKLSKEVRQLRHYEQSLVMGYQAYVKELTKCARLQPFAYGGHGNNVVSAAVTCACTLLTSVPHFNFRSDIIKILVGKLSRRYMDANSKKCLEALETLFRDDEEGRPSMEAVALLAKMMRAKEYQVHESVLNLFLALRLLSEFAGTASHDTVQRTEKASKKKRDFRTKRERKDVKEQKALDKDLQQADALVSHEERERMQSETLKLVFATYFRVLKARVPQLMGAVLEGLATYAHLINQDFFGDLLEALKDLIRYSDKDANGDNEDEEQEQQPGEDEDEEDDEPVRNLTRESLLCTVTAYALLAGQDAHNSRNTLHLDLSFFTNHLYSALLALSTDPTLENTKPTGVTSTTSKINVQTTTVLLLRSLTAVLLPSWNIRSVPPTRLAAFSKQLASAALQLPEKSCQGVLALLNDVAHTHGKKIGSLWNTEERKGDGKYNPVSGNLEGSNPFAATVWEGELLRKHYSPKVREGLKMLEKSMSN
ncbi:nucleolar complex-associated protein-domain-containing protein [Emericellopsis atlantica]|uniref:Nucleolar complex-associated protein 3 n=1 Tax=Emericellopsis atlantica TaxID=2614577 RepID=A0A9P7ZLX2_9HYPO|nr:nucleolar complex-associated protein-domain-containing protein [Emericellopsis atlantica]KAG9253923.1 nucleolar complex-associated protein-domain-containing protein [Emericellopsis atlantica]